MSKISFLNEVEISPYYGSVNKNILSYFVVRLRKLYKGDLVLFTNNQSELEKTANTLRFFAPFEQILEFPSWDCLAYDKISPSRQILAQRASTLAILSSKIDKQKYKGRIVVTTLRAFEQKLAPMKYFNDSSIIIKQKSNVELEQLRHKLFSLGFEYSDPVRIVGQFAVRGDILDIFIAKYEHPVRIDFFADEVENIRYFDPISQINYKQNLKQITVPTISEIFINDETIVNFRQSYRDMFETNGDDSLLYQAISQERSYPGMEHWLPLFYEHTNILDDFLVKPIYIAPSNFKQIIEQNHELVQDYYKARKNDNQNILRLDNEEFNTDVYYPLKPDLLYLNPNDIRKIFKVNTLITIDNFKNIDVSYKNLNEYYRMVDFSQLRTNPKINVYKKAIEFIRKNQKEGRRVLITALSLGARDRLVNIFKDLNLDIKKIDNLNSLESLNERQVSIAVLPLEQGVVLANFCVITEQDLLGDKVISSSRRKLRSKNFLSEVSQIQVGDLIVHLDHGIGRYEGLVTLDILGATHECLKLTYYDNHKLFLPIENIDVLSKYGRDKGNVQLDKLGGTAWQARKSKLKKRIKDIAKDLIKLAAIRAAKSAPIFNASVESYKEFTSSFQYVETEDQTKAIDEVLGDLTCSIPMDRLVCGDVGFGKTEVALRAAYIAVMSGYQVAVIVPTTLLARQHYINFKSRFDNFAINIAQLSRFVSAKQAKLNKEDLFNGKIDVVIGTHAIFAKDVSFKNLGLLIIDEEQHFGVVHKEHLKKMKDTAHVLTLTATPIPRTLQMALTGIRNLSIIATPPIDRLSVHTYVSPYDEIVIKEAILREYRRGGRTFFVCPYVSDIDRLAQMLSKRIPEVKVAIAHGKVNSKELDNTMTLFWEGKYDVLLSTNIIESGTDIPQANTIIIYKSHLFGLSQLHQMRGRVGRAKIQAYAYFLVPANMRLAGNAMKRLEVMQTLDNIGAGFTIASHDLDIRGAGNILGQEQHGNIKEVGVELYQHMLEEEISLMKGEVIDEEKKFIPQIMLGLSVFISENYVSNLDVRMSLYRRISQLESFAEIEAFASEMIDRFGSPLPNEVENLLQTVYLRNLSLKLNVQKIEVGIKGIVLSFFEDKFENLDGLLSYIQNNPFAKVNHKQQIVLSYPNLEGVERINKVKSILNDLAELISL